jgi:hypothetical protein
MSRLFVPTYSIVELAIQNACEQQIQQVSANCGFNGGSIQVASALVPLPVMLIGPSTLIRNQDVISIINLGCGSPMYLSGSQFGSAMVNWQPVPTLSTGPALPGAEWLVEQPGQSFNAPIFSYATVSLRHVPTGLTLSLQSLGGMGQVLSLSSVGPSSAVNCSVSVNPALVLFQPPTSSLPISPQPWWVQLAGSNFQAPNWWVTWYPQWGTCPPWLPSCGAPTGGWKVCPGGAVVSAWQSCPGGGTDQFWCPSTQQWQSRGTRCPQPPRPMPPIPTPPGGGGVWCESTNQWQQSGTYCPPSGGGGGGGGGNVWCESTRQWQHSGTYCPPAGGGGGSGAFFCPSNGRMQHVGTFCPPLRPGQGGGGIGPAPIIPVTPVPGQGGGGVRPVPVPGQGGGGVRPAPVPGQGGGGVRPAPVPGQGGGGVGPVPTPFKPMPGPVGGITSGGIIRPTLSPLDAGYHRGYGTPMNPGLEFTGMGIVKK